MRKRKTVVVKAERGKDYGKLSGRTTKKSERSIRTY